MSVGSDTPAKIYSDQRTVTIHLGDSGDGFTLPFKEKWRAPDAAAAVHRFHPHRRGRHRQPRQRTCAAHPDPRRGGDRRGGVGAGQAARDAPVAAHPRALAVGQPPTPGVVLAPAGAAMTSLAPLRVVGNLRLTAAGVYADYLLSGLPFIFLSQQWQDTGRRRTRRTAAHPAVGRLDQRADRAGPGAPHRAQDAARPPRPARGRGRGVDTGGGAAVGSALPHLGTRRRRAPRPPPHLLADHPAGLRARRATPTGGWRRLLDVALGRDKDSDGVAGRLP